MCLAFNSETDFSLIIYSTNLLPNNYSIDLAALLTILQF